MKLEEMIVFEILPGGLNPHPGNFIQLRPTQ